MLDGSCFEMKVDVFVIFALFARVITEANVPSIYSSCVYLAISLLFSIPMGLNHSVESKVITRRGNEDYRVAAVSMQVI